MRAAAIALADARTRIINTSAKSTIDPCAATLALLVDAHAALSPAPSGTLTAPLSRRILDNLPSIPDVPAEVLREFTAELASVIARPTAAPLNNACPSDPVSPFEVARGLERVYESLLSHDAATSGSTRARLGAVYTPASLAHRLTRDAWTRLTQSPHNAGTSAPIHVLDPSCGSGRFLIASLRVAHASSSPLPILHGVDIDPCAVFLTRLLLLTHPLFNPHGPTRQDPSAMAITDLCARIRRTDALSLALTPASFDLVLGNPPFLNQLERASARNAESSRVLSASTQGVIKGYADTANAFLHRAITLTRPGGITCMIQPLSVLGARDARPLRAWSSRAATLESIWVGDTHAFAASVHACALTLRRTPINPASPTPSPTPHSITLSRGFPPKRVARVRATPATRWSVLASRACGVPNLALPPRLPTLNSWLQATADFRDVYYALRDVIVEAPSQNRATSPAGPTLVPILNTGLIELAAATWSMTPARLFRARWMRPAFDLAHAQQHPSLSRVLPLRLQPKIILATQTRIIEAFVDDLGTWMPTTPLISLTPRPNAPDLFIIAAALCSPVSTLVAARRTFGTSLTPRAIKLAARQALDLPIPSNAASLALAADALRAASRAHARLRAIGDATAQSQATHDLGSEYDIAIRNYAHHATAAYDLTPADQGRILNWWHARRTARRKSTDAGTGSNRNQTPRLGI